MNDNERGEYPSASAVYRLMKCAASHHMAQLAASMRQVAEGNDADKQYGEAMHDAIFTQSDAELEDDQARMDYAKMMRKLREALANWGASNDDLVIREKRMWLHHEVFPIFSGRADYIRLSPDRKKALIIDFKSLWNKVDDPKDNDQLWSQAVLLAEEYPEIQGFALEIISPHYSYLRYVGDVTEVRTYEVRLREMIDRVNGRPEPVPGEWCKHCRGLLVCPAVRKEAADLIKGPRPAELPFDGKKAAKILADMERIDKIIEETKAFYKGILLEHPGSIPGWKTETRTIRKLDNVRNLIKELEPLLGSKVWAAVSVGITKLEASLKKLDPPADDMLVPFVTTRESDPMLIKEIKKRTPDESNGA